MATEFTNGVHIITDPTDPRVWEFASLTDMDLRRRIEQPAGLFIAEGYLVLERIVAKRMRIRSILAAPKRLPRILTIVASLPPELRPPIAVADEDTLRATTGFDMHRGVLAAVQRPATQTVRDICDIDGDIAVLEGLVDPTNVGLAFRSAAAMGFAGCLISADCADPLYRRAIRTSMGAVFELPWARGTSWVEDSAALAASGLTLMALSPRSEFPDVDEVIAAVSSSRVAAIFGSEGDGLRDSTMHNIESIARIPMAAGVDSLNVAATVAVVGYALRCRHGRNDGI